MLLIIFRNMKAGLLIYMSAFLAFLNKIADYLFVEQISAVNRLSQHFSNILFVDCVFFFRNLKVDCSLT